MRRTLLGLVVTAVILMPVPSMAAQEMHTARAPWWGTLMTWVVRLTGWTSERPPQVTPNASSIIDPYG